MSTIDDFFGDSTADQEPLCSYCGLNGEDEELMETIKDHNGPTHWAHLTCQVKAEATRQKKIVQYELDMEFFESME